MNILGAFKSCAEVLTTNLSASHGGFIHFHCFLRL